MGGGLIADPGVNTVCCPSQDCTNIDWQQFTRLWSKYDWRLAGEETGVLHVEE